MIDAIINQVERKFGIIPSQIENPILSSKNTDAVAHFIGMLEAAFDIAKTLSTHIGFIEIVTVTRGAIGVQLFKLKSKVYEPIETSLVVSFIPPKPVITNPSSFPMEIGCEEILHFETWSRYNNDNVFVMNRGIRVRH